MTKEQEINKALEKLDKAFEAYRRSKGIQFADDIKSTAPDLNAMRRSTIEFKGEIYSSLEWR